MSLIGANSRVSLYCSEPRSVHKLSSSGVGRGQALSLEVGAKLVVALDSSFNGFADLIIFHAPVNRHVDHVIHQPLRVFCFLVTRSRLNICQLGSSSVCVDAGLKQVLTE